MATNSFQSKASAYQKKPRYDGEEGEEEQLGDRSLIEDIEMKKNEDDRRSVGGNGINDISRKEEISLGYAFENVDRNEVAGQEDGEETDFLFIGASDKLSIPDPEPNGNENENTPLFDRLRSSGQVSSVISKSSLSDRRLPDFINDQEKEDDNQDLRDSLVNQKEPERSNQEELSNQKALKLEKDGGIQEEEEEAKTLEGSSVVEAFSHSKAAKRLASQERRKARQERKQQRSEGTQNDELGQDIQGDWSQAKGAQQRNLLGSSIPDRSQDGLASSELDEDLADNSCDPGYTPFGQRQKPVITPSLEEIPEAADVTQEMDSRRQSDGQPTRYSLCSAQSGAISLLEGAASSSARTKGHQELAVSNDGSAENNGEPHVEEQEDVDPSNHEGVGNPAQAMHVESTSSLPNPKNFEVERQGGAVSAMEVHQEFGGFDEDDSENDKSERQPLNHLEALCNDEKLTGKSQSLHDNLLQHQLQKGKIIKTNIRAAKIRELQDFSKAESTNAADAVLDRDFFPPIQQAPSSHNGLEKGSTHQNSATTAQHVQQVDCFSSSKASQMVDEPFSSAVSSKSMNNTANPTILQHVKPILNDFKILNEMEATQTKLSILKKAREEEQTAPTNSKPPRHWKSGDDKVKKEDKEIKNEEKKVKRFASRLVEQQQRRTREQEQPAELQELDAGLNADGSVAQKPRFDPLNDNQNQSNEIGNISKAKSEEKFFSQESTIQEYISTSEQPVELKFQHETQSTQPKISVSQQKEPNFEEMIEKLKNRKK